MVVPETQIQYLAVCHFDLLGQTNLVVIYFVSVIFKMITYSVVQFSIQLSLFI